MTTLILIVLGLLLMVTILGFVLIVIEYLRATGQIDQKRNTRGRR